MSFHRSGAAFCVALNGVPSPTPASSRLLIFSCTGAACSRRPGCRGVLSAWGRTFGAGAGFMPFCGRVDQLLDASIHVGELISPQPVQLVYGRLSGTQVLERRGLDWAVCPQHAGDGRGALLDEAGSARPARRRRTTGGAVDFALVSLSEASHGCYLLALRDEGEAACLQSLGVGVGRDGDGQVV